jgi:hypothetical protein
MMMMMTLPWDPCEAWREIQPMRELVARNATLEASLLQRAIVGGDGFRQIGQVRLG